MSSLVWVELDRTAPEHNLRQIRSGAAPGVIACAVIKSNAYGHGAAQIASLLPSAEWFGVNSLEEGLELRRRGITRPVLLLGHVPLAELEAAVEADLGLTVYNRETLDHLSSYSSLPRPARIHVKVDTGTARQGVMPDQLEAFLQGVKRCRNLTLEGISTHYANIEDTLNHEYAELQIARFASALEIVDRTVGRPPFIHTACTAAALLFSSTHFTMLRSGIGLYGLWPSRAHLEDEGRPDQAGPGRQLRGIRLFLQDDADHDPRRPSRGLRRRLRPCPGKPGARTDPGPPRAGHRENLHESLHGGSDRCARDEAGR
jgi:alanine racemase